MPIDYTEYRPIPARMDTMTNFNVVRLPELRLPTKYIEDTTRVQSASDIAFAKRQAAERAAQITRSVSTEALQDIAKTTHAGQSSAVKQAAIKELSHRGLKTSTAPSKLPDMPTAKSVGTRLSEAVKLPSLPKVPTALGKLAPLLKPVGIVGQLLSAPQVFADMGEGLGYLFNLPQNVTNAFEKDRLNKEVDERLKKAQLQKQARDADSARINNNGVTTVGNAYTPPFLGGQMAGETYNVIANGTITYVDTGETLVIRNNDIVTTATGGITRLEVVPTANSLLIVIADTGGERTISHISTGGNMRELTGLSVSLARANGQTDTGGNLPNPNPLSALPAPPVYPERTPDNSQEWQYGNPLIKVGAAPFPMANKPFKEPEAPLPFNVLPAPSANPSATEPDRKIVPTPSGFPKIASPSESPSPTNNAVPTSFNKPSFTARAFVSGKSDPSELGNPVDVKSGLTREAQDAQWQAQNQSVQNRAAANQRASAANDARAVALQLANLSDEPRADLNGKSARQQQTEAYQNSIRGNEIRESAFRTAQQQTTAPQNTTPTTPASTGNNTLQNVAGLAGIAATVTALKLGSDLLVNNSLNNTPKINDIAQNTKNANQQTNAKQGVCDAMQPDQCGFEGVQAATAPIAAGVTANSGLLAQILAAIANLASTISNLFSNVVGKLDLIKEFLEKVARAARLDKVYNLLTFITVVHNASMLSNSLATTLMDTLSLGLATIGIKDENESPIDIQSTINKTVENTVKGIIGTENYTTLSTRWAAAVRVYQAAANIMYQVRSLWDSAKSIAELTGANVGKLANALRRDGVVSENAYPAMADNPMMVNAAMTKLQNLDEAASHLNSITSETYGVTETVAQIKKDQDDFKKLVKESTTAIPIVNDQQKAKDDAAKIASVSPAISNPDLVKPDL